MSFFAELSAHINVVYCFNQKWDCTWTNPEQKEDGIVQCIDVSHSMKGHKTELKLAISALNCMAKTHGCFTVDEPDGSTSIVNMLDHVQEHHPGARVVFFTDGEDTSSWNWKEGCTGRLIKAIDAEGKPLEYHDVPPQPTVYGAERDEWYAHQRAAVCDHMSNSGVHLYVVGIGDDVRRAIAALSARGRVRTAHVARGAAPEEVAAIVATTVRQPPVPREGLARVSNTTAEDLDATRNSGGGHFPAIDTINADTVEVRRVAEEVSNTPEQLVAVTSGALRVRVGDEVALTTDEIKAAVEAAEAEVGSDVANLSNADRLYLRGCVLAMLAMSIRSSSDDGKPWALPGALIGGKKTFLFLEPQVGTTFRQAGNKLLSKLQGTLFVKAKTPALCFTRWEHLYFKYKTTPHYAAHGGVSLEALEAIKTQTDWVDCELKLVDKGNATECAWATARETEDAVAADAAAAPNTPSSNASTPGRGTKRGRSQD